MTGLKYIFSKAQHKLSREESVKMLKWLNPVGSSGEMRRAALSRGAATIYWEFLIVPRRNDAHSWATLLIWCMCLNNSSAFFTCQAGSHLPVGDRDTESRRAPLFDRAWPCFTWLFCSQQSTTRWHIDQTQMIAVQFSHRSAENLNRPPSTALLHKTAGSGRSSLQKTTRLPSWSHENSAGWLDHDTNADREYGITAQIKF